MTHPQIQMVFFSLNASIATSTYHSKLIVKFNVDIACSTPKSQYKFYDPPLGIAMGITLHMEFTIPMQVLHQKSCFP
jgi:hypothetical protein